MSRDLGVYEIFSTDAAVDCRGTTSFKSVCRHHRGDGFVDDHSLDISVKVDGSILIGDSAFEIEILPGQVKHLIKAMSIQSKVVERGKKRKRKGKV